MSPDLFTEWRELLLTSLHPTAAVEAFKSMARGGSLDITTEFPVLPALNAKAPTGKPIRVRFDLRELKGDHDHCLYKATGDTKGRAFAGYRRTEDFQAERAETIAFIPVTLLKPDFVYCARGEPWTHLYLCRIGPKRFFLVAIHLREKGEPRFSFVTAYPLDEASLESKRKKWTRLYAKPKEERAP